MPLIPTGTAMGIVYVAAPVGLTPDVPGMLPMGVVLAVVVLVLVGTCCCAIAVRARHAAVMMDRNVRFMGVLVKSQRSNDERLVL
jgi:hypothetical protein